MKVKVLDLTANLAWSPSQMDTVHLASGTAAQQLDATFSTTSALEVHRLDLAKPGRDMTRACSMPVDHRYHKLVWCGAGIAEGGRPSGVLAGGLDGGVVALYDAHKLVNDDGSGAADALMAKKDKHTGPVQALDFNPFQVGNTEAISIEYFAQIPFPKPSINEIRLLRAEQPVGLRRVRL